MSLGQRLISTCLVFHLFGASVAAQLVFDAGDLAQSLVAVGANTYHVVLPQRYPELEAIIAAGGGNQTYDFSSFTYYVDGPYPFQSFTSAVGTPGENDPNFSQANDVRLESSDGVSGVWNYFKIADDGYYHLGSILAGQTEQVSIRNEPAPRLHMYPLTAGTSWDQDYVVTYVYPDSEVPGVVSEHLEVDGWGTLITPSGSAECLRLRRTFSDNGSAGKVAVTVDQYTFLTKGKLQAIITYSRDLAAVASGAYIVTDDATGTFVEDSYPEQFELRQNFPNPFSRTTTIAFEMDSPGEAMLRVFDVTGREVATLLDGMMNAGLHRAELNGEGLTNGVYFYRLQVNGRVSMRSLMLQR